MFKALPLLALLLSLSAAHATTPPREGCEPPHCYAFVFWAEARDGEVRGWQSPNFRDMLECKHKLRAMLRNKRSLWNPRHIAGRCMKSREADAWRLADRVVPRE